MQYGDPPAAHVASACKALSLLTTPTPRCWGGFRLAVRMTLTLARRLPSNTFDSTVTSLAVLMMMPAPTSSSR
jgi:hypothetical protein